MQASALFFYFGRNTFRYTERSELKLLLTFPAMTMKPLGRKYSVDHLADFRLRRKKFLKSRYLYEKRMPETYECCKR